MQRGFPGNDPRNKNLVHAFHLPTLLLLFFRIRRLSTHNLCSPLISELSLTVTLARQVFLRKFVPGGLARALGLRKRFAVDDM